MPSRKKIADFWLKTLQAFDKDGQEGVENGECCFACGRPFWLERCHINPHWLGGTESVENLHVLCKVCHLFSEDYTGSDYWRWFRDVPFYWQIETLHRGWIQEAILNDVRSPTAQRMRAAMERKGINVTAMIEAHGHLSNGVPSTF